MKKTFRKILMSVIYVMLVMPVWAKGDITIKTVDAATGKAVSGMLVEVHNNKGPYLDSADIQKFNNAKYKTGGNGSLQMPGWCSILHVAQFTITVSDASGKYSSANYTTTPQHNKTNCSDVVLKVTSKVSEEDKKKKDDVAHCATPENDPSIANITACVNWGDKSTWKTSGTCKMSNGKSGECKAVSSSDAGYQAKKDCWIMVGASRMYLPKPSGNNIYRCSAAAVLSISGTVVDAKTNEPLPFANIQITKADGTAIANKGCTTNDKGAFSEQFKDVPNGAKMLVQYVGYTKQTLTPGQNMQIKLVPQVVDLPEVKIEVDLCDAATLANLHATAGRNVQKEDRAYCIPTTCVDTHELQGEVCVAKTVGGTLETPGTTDPNGGTPGVPTVPGTTDPNIAVTPIVVNPVVVTPAPKVATCQTPIKVDAVRSALGNAPADMDKQKFMDTLSACNVVTVCEILEACVKSVPAGVACKECERFIRDIVGYHNG